MIDVREERPAVLREKSVDGFPGESHTDFPEYATRSVGTVHSRFLFLKHVGTIKAILNALVVVPCTGKATMHVTTDNSELSGVFLAWDAEAHSILEEAIRCVHDQLRAIDALDLVEYELKIRFVLTRTIS